MDSQKEKAENQHIPKYIKDQPWYYKDIDNGKDDYLSHHRKLHKDDENNDLAIDNNAEPKLGRGIKDVFANDVTETTNKWSERNALAPKTTAVTFHTFPSRGKRERKCTNCGGMDHVKRDCLERPRKQVSHLHSSSSADTTPFARRLDNENWDAKKDRWFGYTGKEYDQILQSWESKKKQKKSEAKQEDHELIDTDEEIELMSLGLYKDAVTGLLSQDDSNSTKLRASVRLREDKAVYLNDIHSDTINYDPKSRLYKSEELGEIDPQSQMFHRHLTGESLELQKLNRFAREQTLKSGVRDEVEDDSKTKHVLVANPTKYELMLKQKEDHQQQQQQQHRPLKVFDGQSAKRVAGTAQTKENKKRLLDRYG